MECYLTILSDISNYQPIGAYELNQAGLLCYLTISSTILNFQPIGAYELNQAGCVAIFNNLLF